MIEEARFPSVQKFRSLTDHERSEIIEKYLEKDQNPNWSFNLSADETRKFINQMLDTGRFERFGEFDVIRKRSFAILHSTGSDCELLFRLDELEPDAPIQLAQMGNSDPFNVFHEAMTFHFGDIGTEELQRSLHQYFVTYGVAEDDEEDEDGDYSNSWDDEEWPVTNEDSHMAQTVLMLSRVYGDSKIISLLDRVNSGDNITALEFLKIIQSDVEILEDAPLSWSASLA